VNQRPFYRSRSFWFGLPGLVFLLWGWWDSGKRYSEMAWVMPNSFVAIYQHQGRVCFVITDKAPGAGRAFSGSGVEFHQGDRPAYWHGGGVEVLISGLFGATTAERSIDREEAKARRYYAPGLYRLRWGLFYHPVPHYGGSSPSLNYREWGAEWWLVVSAYGVLFSLFIVARQRRKSRILKLHSAPPP
jgi:hypothetical protein